MIAIVVIGKFTVNNHVDGVVRTHVEVEIAVILHVWNLVTGRLVKQHIDALAGTHAVCVDGKSGALVLAVRLETDGQTARSVIDSGRDRQRGGGDGIGGAVVQDEQHRVVDGAAVIDKQCVGTVHVKRGQIQIHPHGVVVRVVGTNGDVIVHIGAVVTIKAAIVIDRDSTAVHGGLRTYPQRDYLGLERQYAAYDCKQGYYLFHLSNIS